jgi:hypothetical protein
MAPLRFRFRLDRSSALIDDSTAATVANFQYSTEFLRRTGKRHASLSYLPHYNFESDTPIESSPPSVLTVFQICLQHLTNDETIT